MDTNIPSGMPEHVDMPVGTPTPSPSPSSLIHTPSVPQKAHAPALLWLLVFLVLLGAGFLGYVAYAQNATLTAHDQWFKTYQENLTQWTNQVNTLQSSVEDLRTQVAQLPTVLPTPTPSILPSTPGAILPFPGMTTLPISPSVPGMDTNLKGDDDIFEDMDDPNSLSGGRMTPEDETGMVASYLSEIKAGQHKTSQPDSISVFKSRQLSSDGSVTFDIFKSTSEEDTFYMYVRQGTGIQPGWFGPFSSFPGA